MPVNIYRVQPEGLKNDRVAWLCDDIWILRPQIEVLAKWLDEQPALPEGKYVADVGFCWRRDACGGGPVLEPGAMRRMADLCMSLYLSEYGSFADELTDDQISAQQSVQPDHREDAAPG